MVFCVGDLLVRAHPASLRRAGFAVRARRCWIGCLRDLGRRRTASAAALAVGGSGACPRPSRVRSRRSLPPVFSRRGTRGTVFAVLIGLALLVGAGVIAYVFVASGQPEAIGVGFLLALLPVGPLVLCYLWLDRYEPEPGRLLAMAFGWGALVATATALVLQVVDDSISGRGMVWSGGRRRAALRGGRQGRLRAAPAVAAPPRHPRRPRRPGVRRAGGHRLRVHREHPLLRRRLRRRDGPGPGRLRGGDHDLRRARRLQPLRPPAVHLGHRHRRRHHGRLAPALAALARAR